MQLLSYLLIGLSLVGQQNNPGTFDQPMLIFASAGPFRKCLYFILAQADNRGFPAHAQAYIQVL